jgi:serine/threonine protein kinase/formylglycine-generating enzyme required for sulfatase activity
VDVGFLQSPTTVGAIGRLGHYEILQVLGQGAFGIVFKAFDQKLHRLVAIKAMNPQLAATSPPRQRFLREARSVAAIKHENIVQIYSVEEDPLPYLVMEYIDGQTLQQLMDRTGPLDIALILTLGQQIASGLAAAHDKGLVHRDIKPGNILLEAGVEQKVKITDFGLARAADDASMTRTGMIAGTPLYMAPEQALGRSLDYRADLFSLGSVLYQMACGRPPFRGATAIAVLKRVVDEPARPIQDIHPDTPDWLHAIVSRLHAKNPAERFQSANDVVRLLKQCQASMRQYDRVELPDDVAVYLPKAVAAATSEPVAATAERTMPDYDSRPTIGRGRIRGVAAILALLSAAVMVGLEATHFTDVHGAIRRWISPTDNRVEPWNSPDASSQKKSGDGPSAVVQSSTSINRAPQYRTKGDWKLEAGEFFQESPQRSLILFGDPQWTDYDIEVEAMSHGARDGHGIILLYRARDYSNYQNLEVGGGNASVTEASSFQKGEWSRIPGCFLKTPHEHERWYQIKIEARGPRIRCWVDGKNLLTYRQDDLLQGMIGFASGNALVRWRKLQVTGPDGRVLWEGFPNVDSTASSPIDRLAEVPGKVVVPFEERQARLSQEEWAKYLQRSVVEVNSIGMKMAMIPPGVFQMGANTIERDGAIVFNGHPKNEELPKHEVYLSRPFMLSVTEVTQDEYAKTTGRNSSDFSPSGGKAEQVKDIGKESLPVEMVSWFDAIEFCNKLSEKEGLPSFYDIKFIVHHQDGGISVADVSVMGGVGYRLPTEAEWEFACRAGTTTPFYFKFDYGTMGQYGWFGYIDRPHGVGERKPNAFGICDMHGNVHEWCHDWFGPYAEEKASDPSGPETGTEKVMRGGAYNYLPPYARSAWRGRTRPGARQNNLGFRVARFVSGVETEPIPNSMSRKTSVAEH